MVTDTISDADVEAVAEQLEMTPAVIRELREGTLMQRARAEKEQRIAAKLSAERRRMQHGQVQFQVHAESYHYWGQRLGYACWKDKQFVAEFLRDNPECRVVNHSNKIMVGYSPSASKSRFHKRYS